ncbi:MAG: S8 family serine peptidase [Candidatus Cloacimonetes bacterium]|nr:S8 family serine peptidase [Candidatus Cloacimonadota bacterium]
MRNLFLFVLAMLIVCIISDIYSIDSEVRFGERPYIDLYQIPTEAMEQGWIRIQFKEELSDYLDIMKLSRESSGNIVFGISDFDELNRYYEVQSVVKLFDSSVLKGKFEERHRLWGFHLWYELHFNSTEDIRDIVMAYRQLSDIIKWAEPEYKKQLNSELLYTQMDNEDLLRWTPNDPQLSNQWHYHNTGQQNGTPGADISLLSAWDIEKGHTSVIVAIIDDGIQTNHPDLSGNIWSGVGYNFVDGNSNIIPGNHGTHVAGTVSAVNNNNVGVAGVAGGSGTGNGVRLMSCQVFRGGSNGGFHLAPIYAADNGAAISQNSWSYTQVGAYDVSVLNAIDYFNANGGGNVLNGGITIFAASNNNTTGQWYPACYTGTFSVAATNNQDQKAWYSTYESWVDISAPGGETNQVTARGVLSTVTGSSYSYYQGTSMACPHASGVAALVISYAYRNGLVLNNSEVAGILRDTTDDHYSVNPNYIGQLGSGRLNAHTALIETGNLLIEIENPTDLATNTVGLAQIDLSWINNEENNNVLLVWSPTGIFGNPISGTAYSVGQQIPGGGTVLYRGNATTYSHTLLEPATVYHYKAFSYNYQNRYSSGVSTTGITDYISIPLPISEVFDEIDTKPYFWEIIDHQGNGQVWDFGTISNGLTGTTGNYAFLNSNAYGSGSSQNSDLITPILDLTNYYDLIVSFTHYFRHSTNSTATFSYSIDNGNTWSTISTWTGSSSPNPAYFSQAVLQVLGHSEVRFKWNYTGTGGWYWCVDDIEISGLAYEFAEPRNLVAIPSDTEVNLFWSSPLDDTPLGYNIYRNHLIINPELILNSYYVDYEVTNGISYHYYVTAQYEQGISEPSNNTVVTPYITFPVLPKPNNLSAGVFSNAILLSWEAPELGIWLNWDKGINYSSIGNGGPIQFKAAIRYSSAILDILDLNGFYLTKIKFFPREQSASYTLNVWKGGSETEPGYLILEQPVTVFQANTWNTIELQTPVDIDAEQEIWFGYSVDTQTGFPAGCDSGPANNGYGNMLWYSGEWTTLTEMGASLNYNWNIKGYFEYLDDNELYSSLQGDGTDVNLLLENSKQLRRISLNEINNHSNKSSHITRNLIPEILGYNVYRNGLNITPEPITSREYYDYDVVSGLSYDYYVTTIYTNGESEPSNIVETTAPFFPIIIVTPQQIEKELFVGEIGEETITIRNEGEGNLEFTISIDDNQIRSELTLLNREDPTWLSISPLEGDISPEDSLLVFLEFDSTNLSGGLYEAVLTISSNDPQTPQIELPISCTVFSPDLPSPQNIDIIIDNNMIILSWDIVTGADYYIVEMTDDINSQFVNISSELGLFSQNENRINWSMPFDSSQPRLFFRVRASHFIAR